MRRVVVTIAAVVSLVACSSISASPTVNTGPLGNGGTPGEECVSTGSAGSAVIGIDVLTNQGSDTVTIDSVALTNPKQLTLSDAVIVPITGTNLVGVGPTFPPATGPDPGVMWAQRQPAKGATIAPGPEIHNLVATVVAASPTGSSAGLDVLYHDSHNQYELRTATRIRVEVEPSKCTL